MQTLTLFLQVSVCYKMFSMGTVCIIMANSLLLIDLMKKSFQFFKPIKRKYLLQVIKFDLFYSSFKLENYSEDSLVGGFGYIRVGFVSAFKILCLNAANKQKAIS